DEKRGDVIDVSAVEFLEGLDGEPVAAPGVMERLGRYTGTMINAGAFIVVVFLLAFFGLRPMASALTARPAAALAGPSFDEAQRSLPTPEGAAAGANPDMPAGALTGGQPGQTPLDDLRRKLRPAP